MNSSIPASAVPIDRRFRPEIAWLGPIVGMPFERDRTRLVWLAGTEDPALGKAFVAVLVPVRREGERFVRAGTSWRPLDKFLSDQHGWFRLEAPTDLWSEGLAGRLLVLLYNQWSDLKYYSYQEYIEALGRQAPADLSTTKPALRLLPTMPPGVRDEVEKAMDGAVDRLLAEKTVTDLEPGLAEIGAAAGPMRPDPADAGVTLPVPPADAGFVLAFASCQYPTGMLEAEVAGASYSRLATRLDRGGRDKPQCLLLVGDQIYVDGTAGLFDPTSQFDRYVRPYEIFYRMVPVRSVLRRLPAFMMLDDHELVDNWESRIDDGRPDPDMVAGRRSYEKFQRRHGPEMTLPVGKSAHPLWYVACVNGFPMFVADVRTERDPRTAETVPRARIMRDEQLKALLDWLRDQPRDVPKIVASSSILLPRHARAIQWNQPESALRSDGWDGYPRSMYRVLAHIAENRIPNVVFLSGDEHLSCVARATLAAKAGAQVVIHSVHSSPLFAPFPFANAERADLVVDDRFEFPAHQTRGQRVTCTVRTEFARAGDGFAVLRFERAGGGWTMRCAFDRAGRPPDPIRSEGYPLG